MTRESLQGLVNSILSERLRAYQKKRSEEYERFGENVRWRKRDAELRTGYREVAQYVLSIWELGERFRRL
jgi:hypothetical protein